MEFSFENLGVIKEANIKLDGLTVLTGLNDTGKSFISKAIFSIIKTVNQATSQAISEKYDQARVLINQIYSTHRQFVPFTPTRAQQFSPGDIGNKLLTHLISKNTDLALLEIKNYTERVVEDIRLHFEGITAPRNIEAPINKIRELSGDIQYIVLTDTDNREKYKTYFDNYIIDKLFQGQLNNLSDISDPLIIKVKEGVSDVLELSVRDNKTQSFDLKNLLILNDVTIIESPIIFQVEQFITNTLAFPKELKKVYQQRTTLPYTFYDIIEKMNSPSNVIEFGATLFQDIKTLIGGQLEYDLEQGMFLYKKNNGFEIKPFNIATGIKSLGIIQLLLNSGTINKNSVLIIDEPEVHLHPKWEVEYASVICKLAALGIKILISSHSPYLLRAIRKYSREIPNLEDITTFYFGERINESHSKFRDITENPEPIFKTLAEPMMSLS